MTRTKPPRTVLILAMLAGAAIAAPNARGDTMELYCEAPVTFFDAGWYYCEDLPQGVCVAYWSLAGILLTL